MYYFPHSFKLTDNKILKPFNSGNYVNSGKSALKIAFKKLNLPINSLIAVPAFVCNSVIEAIEEVGYRPHFLDFKNENSFWANYNDVLNKNINVQAILLAHLYGFCHPNTPKITDFAKQNNIPIIHDAAQSFGIDELLFGNSPVVYSFGPGKSTSAALGGEVKNVELILADYQTPSLKHHLKARLFFYSRFHKHPYSIIATLIGNKLSGILKTESAIVKMTDFQVNKAEFVKQNIEVIRQERVERYQLLKNAINLNKQFSLCYDDDIGQYFKLVFTVNKQFDVFKSYLIKHQIPFYNLYTDIFKNRNLNTDSLFAKQGPSIFEISCEKSIPLCEFERIAKLLIAY
jgi:hypothetical protein